ncbi:4-alpha-glucanotransferase [Desulfobaculum xiamenense]|uniref:4-alpha-glucanotransferase n=1 Tax=Desulfobaculum xiamenense TaxID=995050 RepID=A0A846QJC2_9BACT|nr:4-alpha-glucanotransferase [Desulfobaculum xiamenense]NJB68966.1 4-alpha-glucanotransferase [Desulfobaculum xiamenense]
MIEHMSTRGSGVLLHVSSLPSPYGIGDLGSAARLFVDFLARAGQRYWQILPLTPTSSYLGNSPYSSFSAFAGNPLFISPEKLAADGWAWLSDIQPDAPMAADHVDYVRAEAYKRRLLAAVHARARGRLARHEGFAEFREQHGPTWLDGFASFMVLKERFGGMPWNEWPPEYRDRSPQALDTLRREAAEGLERVMFAQYLFFSQWEELRAMCRERGVSIIGDLPFYPTYDSADVWEHRNAFQLDEEGAPRKVAGVPPDYFSETGQRWGNPVYDWNALAATGYRWWVERIAHNLLLADIVRLDHFRGFAGYWVVDPAEETAINGHWETGPGGPLFAALRERLPNLPIIAEDLGLITRDVIDLRLAFDLPGMRVLQFSFGPDVGESVNSLHNHCVNSVAYTGTHDNNTTIGWFVDDLGDAGRSVFGEYMGRGVDAGEAAWMLMRMAFMSPARIAIVPMQDILCLGREARMNVPSRPKGNWEWRLPARKLAPRLADRLRSVCVLYGRTGEASRTVCPET